MTIHSQLQPSPERGEAIGRAALSCLLAIAGLEGPPSAIALPTIIAVRDHLIHLPLPLEGITLLNPLQLAADVALTTTFGPSELESFQVWTA